MKIDSTSFGLTRTGLSASLYSVTNRNGMTAVLTNYGAILVKLLIPCPDSSLRDVVLGYDTLSAYEQGGFFGATVGRHANRIAGAAFTLDGVTCQLENNDNGCNLHSSFQTGFHKQLWQAEMLEDGVCFSRLSPDGEAGFPGNLEIRVTYRLDDRNGLHIIYDGRADRKTLINLTNHSFFNLDGHDSGHILDERVTLYCPFFLEIDEHRLPTGRILPADGTAMDFRSGKRVGDEIDASLDQLQFAHGYDHCYVTEAGHGMMKKIALVEASRSGLSMEAWTDLPGVQFYTANFLPDQAGKAGAIYGPRSGLCLETEYFPDSIHHPAFPQAVFGPEKAYHAETLYRFV